MHAHDKPGASLAEATLVVWAVKPQTFHDAALQAGPHNPNALHLSVAAGIRSDSIAGWLGTERVVRAMPNTPALIDQGVTALFARSAVTAADRRVIDQLVQTTGSHLWLDAEAQLDAVTALSGSGPAYVFYFICYCPKVQGSGFRAIERRGREGFAKDAEKTNLKPAFCYFLWAVSRSKCDTLVNESRLRVDGRDWPVREDLKRQLQRAERDIFRCLCQLLVLALGLFHCLRFELLGKPVKPDEHPPAYKQKTEGNEDACRVKGLRRIIVQDCECRNQPLYRQRNHNHYQEARQISAHARRSADTHFADNLFLHNSLCNLECDSGHSDQPNRFDNLL